MKRGSIPAETQHMALETIAEGIETFEQEQALIALGCPLGQGYLYGKPMPFDDALALIAQQNGLGGDAATHRRSAVVSRGKPL